MAGLCGIAWPTGAVPPGPDFPAPRLLTALRERGEHVEAMKAPRAWIASADWRSPKATGARLGDVWVVGDLRLGDRSGLRRDLASVLHPLPELSDPELVLAAYRAWGVDFADHLDGEFAVAVWDEGERRLILARDPLGIKPLHLSESPVLGGIAFASEAWALAAQVGAGLDRLTVARYLAGLPRGRDRSFFSEVCPLEPGHVLVADVRGIRRRCFWDPAARPRIRHPRVEDYAEELRHLLRTAVADRVTDAAPVVGVAMSGGIDSCAVAAFARREAEERGTPVPRAFSLTFDGLSSCDESDTIDAVEAELGLAVERIPASGFWRWTAPGPVGDAPLLTWEQAFGEMTRRVRSHHGRVLLTGHGADDLLCGNPLILASRLRRGDVAVVPELLRAARRHGVPGSRTLYRRLVRPFLPATADRFLRRISGRTVDRFPDWLDPDLVARLRADPAPSRPASWDPRRVCRWELLETVRQLPGLEETLTWLDRIAARSGVEIRHPFLDRRLVEWVLGVPPEAMFRLGEHKSLLRRAVRDELPAAVLSRPAKARLGAHVDACVERERPTLEGWLAAPCLAAHGLVIPERLAARFIAPGDATPGRREAYRALFLEGWLRSIRSGDLDFNSQRLTSAA
jgi:asparagine synthase (glutamine-hydrolysing)